MSKVLFVKKNIGLVENLGIMYLAAALKRVGHQTDIIRCDQEPLREKIQSYKPDIVAMSATTGTHNWDFATAKYLKGIYPNLPIILGGAHATFFPESLEKSSFDVFCIGEGEESFNEFVNNPKRTNTKNIWFKEGNRIIKNPVRPLIKNLDDVPFPDRDLIYKFKENRENHIANVIASRGCPYSCSYCFNSAYYEIYNEKENKRVRLRSPDNIIAELKEIKDTYPQKKFIFFQDDIFPVYKEKWFDELMEKYGEINMPFHCQIRPNMIREKIVKKLKKAGCHSITMAFESGDERTRRELLGRNMSDEEMLYAAKLLRKEGIKYRIENMVGLPGGLENDLKTLDLNIAAQPTIAWASLLLPYPKTKIYNYCVENGYFDGNLDDFPESFFEYSVLNIPHKKEIERLQKIFSIVVEYPILRPYIRVLINLPLDKLYQKVYKKFKIKKYDNELYR